MPYPLDVPLADLRRRRSQKWVDYPEDVLPLFVAETDVLLAPAIRERLAAAVADGDAGYSADAAGLARVSAEYYSRFGWRVPPAQVVAVTDVGVGIREVLSRALPSGGQVVYTPPVYPPFAPWIKRSGLTPVPVPLVGHDGPDPHLDLPGIERAFASGARAILLSHPHNPTGHLHSDTELAELATVADRFDALVVSDEIWAPLTLPGIEFRSFLAVSDTARQVGVALSSASKAFNLAGLKCAFVVHGNPEKLQLPASLAGGVGHLGSLAARVAFGESLGWLGEFRGALDANLDVMADLLAEYLPQARWRRPDAGFVAWLDLRGYPGLGGNPAAPILEHGRVALSSGPAFGQEGTGFARLNFACSTDILIEAIERIGKVANG